ncbi:tRNA 2-thiouridine synthesizing protein A [Paraburkholderia sp. WSM4175]
MEVGVVAMPGGAAPPAVEFDPLSGVVSDAPSRRSSSMQIQIHKEVDARGLMCPLPILRAKKALADMESGQILKVLATDPGSQRDFAAFAKQTGNEIVESSAHDKVFTFLMRRR